jgi:undecaprenyl-diphosphatase
MSDFFWQLDQTILRQINTVWTAPWLDRLMYFISDPNPFIPFLIGGSLLLALFGRGRARPFLVLMLLALVLGDGGINWGFKRLVNRPRPYQTLENIRVVKADRIEMSRPGPVERGRSFTSGHACNNVALAFMATWAFGWRWGAFLWLWACFVSYSRIYVGAHYPSDILGSWIVAPLYCWCFLAGLHRLWAWSGPRYFPRTYTARPQL